MSVINTVQSSVKHSKIRRIFAPLGSNLLNTLSRFWLWIFLLLISVTFYLTVHWFLSSGLLGKGETGAFGAIGFSLAFVTLFGGLAAAVGELVGTITLFAMHWLTSFMLLIFVVLFSRTSASKKNLFYFCSKLLHIFYSLLLSIICTFFCFESCGFIYILLGSLFPRPFLLVGYMTCCFIFSFFISLFTIFLLFFLDGPASFSNMIQSLMAAIKLIKKNMGIVLVLGLTFALLRPAIAAISFGLGTISWRFVGDSLDLPHQQLPWALSYFLPLDLPGFALLFLIGWYLVIIAACNLLINLYYVEVYPQPEPYLKRQKLPGMAQ